MDKKKIAIVAFVVLVLLIGAASWFFLRSSRTPLPPAGPPEKVATGEHILGDAKANLLMVEYGSPTCSICAQWDKEVFPQLKQKYIDTGKVLFVYRIMPRNQTDGEVARLAACLPKEKFFGFIGLLYRNQEQWDADEYPTVTDGEAALARLATQAGLSDARIAACRAPNKAVDDETNSVAAAGAAKYGISGTPTFVIDGSVQGGFLYWDSLQLLLDASLAAKK